MQIVAETKKRMQAIGGVIHEPGSGFSGPRLRPRRAWTIRGWARLISADRGPPFKRGGTGSLPLEGPYATQHKK